MKKKKKRIKTVPGELHEQGVSSIVVNVGVGAH
jgi:hypothetical protein